MNLADARILVVDDEPMLLEMFSKWLRLVGCGHAGCGEVFTAANGAEALTLMQGQPIDLLLSDVRMPVMDGIELVRSLAEEGRTVPSIVFVSGFGDLDRREMYALGVEAFVAKPFDRSELLQILEKAVAERSSLWHTAMTGAPRQTLLLEAKRFNTDASTQPGDETIGLGRGGFCACTPDGLCLSLGKVAFRLLLADPTIAIAGQGYVRWFSRNDGKAGVEFAYLEPEGRAWLTQAIMAASPRSFIPGS